jgi:phage anti-repressor protein
MSINQITTINLLEDDNLIQKIRNKFNADDMQIFEFNINIYKTFKNNKNDFIIEFDEVCKYIGFSRIDHAKRLLIKEFIDKNDYIIIFPPKGENVLGRKKEKIMLNIKCFKKFCLVAATKQSKILYDYYITMEEIIMEYMEEQFNNQNTIL